MFIERLSARRINQYQISITTLLSGDKERLNARKKLTTLPPILPIVSGEQGRHWRHNKEPQPEPAADGHGWCPRSSQQS